MNKAKAVEVVEKAMKKDHLMSQTIVDLQYPHLTDKKIMKLRQSGDLNEGILKVCPSRDRMKDLLHVLQHGVDFLSSMHGYGIPCVSGQPSPRNN
jgi:hypothetical protein